MPSAQPQFRVASAYSLIFASWFHSKGLFLLLKCQLVRAQAALRQHAAQAITAGTAVFVLSSRKSASREDQMDQTFSRRSVLGYAAGSAAGAVLLTSSAP